LYVGWFTFFLTTILAAVAWSFVSSLDKNGKLVAPGLFYGVVGFFEVQIILGLLGTKLVRRSLAAQDARALCLLKIFADEAQGDYKPMSPVPEGLHGALDTMRIALIANLVFWFIAAAAVAILTYNGYSVGGTQSAHLG